MLLENINIEIATLSAAVFGLVLMLFVLNVRKKEGSQHEPLRASEKIDKKPLKLELVEIEEDEDDVVTEVINTMDYHQVPKALIAEKARKLAAGGN